MSLRPVDGDSSIMEFIFVYIVANAVSFVSMPDSFSVIEFNFDSISESVVNFSSIAGTISSAVW